MAEQIRIEGIDKLVKSLGAIQAKKVLKAVITAGALSLKGRVAKPAPSTKANLPKQPGEGSWYERGFGNKYARKSGGIGGKRTSERLGASWAIRVSPLSAEVGNKAKYAPWVQSSRRIGGRGPQTSFHRKNGWTVLEDEARRELPRIEKRMQDFINKQIGQGLK